MYLLQLFQGISGTFLQLFQFFIASFGKKSFSQENNIFHKVVINRFVKNVYICEQKKLKI